MAVSNPVDTNIRLVFSAGVNEEGKPLYKGRTYGNIKINADNDQIFRAAQAIASLSANPLFAIERVDRSEISE